MLYTLNTYNYIFQLFLNKVKKEIRTKLEANCISDKQLLFKVLKELYNSGEEEQSIKKWAEELNRNLFKKDINMVNRYMKRCSTSRCSTYQNHNKLSPHTC